MYVYFDRPFSDKQGRRDFPVAHIRGRQAEHLKFAASELDFGPANWRFGVFGQNGSETQGSLWLARCWRDHPLPSLIPSVRRTLAR